MKLAFVFPGQGSQYVGMASDLYEKFNEIKDLYDEANELLGFDIIKYSFEGPEETLKQTFITQPAIFLHSLSISKIIASKIESNFIAGHSLGEYTALVYAEVLSFKDGLKLVKHRGELMQKAGEKNKGTMAAVIGLNAELLDKICLEISEEDIVQIANINSPGQLVISGSINGVKRAMESSKLNKAKLVKELVVHGAFHSPLMQQAKDEFREILNSVEFKSPKIPVYSNVTAKAYTTKVNIEEIKNTLHEQITSPVRWEESVVNMTKDGAEEFIELGPGKVLQGLIKRIVPNIPTRGFDKVDDLKGVTNNV